MVWKENWEGHGKENPEVKPINQILQTSLDKEKPSKSWELPLEQKKAIYKGQVEMGKNTVMQKNSRSNDLRVPTIMKKSRRNSLVMGVQFKRELNKNIAY